MQLITISGLDGSGKTTQLDKLEKELKAVDKKVYRLHIIDFSLANRLLGSKKKKDSSSYTKSVVKAGKFAIFLRKIALILDILHFNRFKTKLCNNKGYDYILTDRYFYDQIINILYLEKNSKKSQPPALWQKIAEKLIKKPDLAIFIQVSPEIALSRDREIEQGKQFLTDKQKLFDTFKDTWKIKVVNGEGTTKNVFEKIKKNTDFLSSQENQKN